MAGGYDALSLFVGVVRQDWEGCRRNCVYHGFLLFGSMYYVVGVAFQYICFCYTRVEILEGSSFPEHWSRWRGGGGTLAFSSTSLFGQPAPELIYISAGCAKNGNQTSWTFPTWRVSFSMASMVSCWRENINTVGEWLWIPRRIIQSTNVGV